jgi:hypothetical protein
MLQMVWFAEKVPLLAFLPEFQIPIYKRMQSANGTRIKPWCIWKQSSDGLLLVLGHKIRVSFLCHDLLGGKTPQTS